MGTVDFFIKVGKGVIAMQSEDQHRTLFILTNPAMNMELKENAKEAEDEENVRIKFMSGAANPEEHSAFWGRASAYQKIRLIGTGKGWKNNYAHLYPERRHGAVAIKCGRMKDTILRAHRVVFEERSEFCNYLLECSQEGCHRPILVYKEMSALIMKDVLEFIYLGEVVIPRNTLDIFMEICNFLGLQGIKPREIYAPLCCIR